MFFLINVELFWHCQARTFKYASRPCDLMTSSGVKCRFPTRYSQSKTGQTAMFVGNAPGGRSARSALNHQQVAVPLALWKAAVPMGLKRVRAPPGRAIDPRPKDRPPDTATAVWQLGQYPPGQPLDKPNSDSSSNASRSLEGER
ncbi:hypothetical protein UPYG_G00183000 [Umbra pygmaea]|uniref:Uncharacterized protein n=1 Tax=Umbra pygmaea TaxID=75934 RepID=A0ABD0WR16_UMBPY